MTMEIPPFEGVFPIENGNFPTDPTAHRSRRGDEDPKFSLTISSLMFPHLPSLLKYCMWHRGSLVPWGVHVIVEDAPKNMLGVITPGIARTSGPLLEKMGMKDPKAQVAERSKMFKNCGLNLA